MSAGRLRQSVSAAIRAPGSAPRSPSGALPALLSTGLLVVLGCSVGYRTDLHGPPRHAGQAEWPALRVVWGKQLVQRELLGYRPQEWSSAAIDERGTIYVGSSARRLLALASDGHELWHLATRGVVASRPLYHAETGAVYFGADDGQVYAVDARSGRLRWTFSTEGTIAHAPVYHDGVLLFTTSENRVYGIDARNGRWRWQYDREPGDGFGMQGFAGVLVHDNLAFTGFSDGMLVALRPGSGALVWTRSLSGGAERFVDVDVTPVAVGGAVVAASHSGGVYALAPETGAVQWQLPIEGVVGLTATARRVFVSSVAVGVVALNGLGRELWRQGLPSGVPAAVLALGPYLLVTGTETGLFVVAAESGDLLQYFDPGHGFSAPASAGSGLVVVLSNLGRLYALDFT
ncbi:MAG: PQQ-binding-like beta-propeller repeat protein [Proteobacteria bacterium]|nr:PQQ-binding-like beta-propeller repeat protein [Pseudomonadota bacterium]